MSNLIPITLKHMSKQDMNSLYKDMILKDRELLIETEGENETFVCRFKIGDGRTPYNQLNYVSSIYALLPNCTLYNKEYTQGINLIFKSEDN